MTKEEVKALYKNKCIPKIKEEFDRNGIVLFVAYMDAWNDLLDLLFEQDHIEEEQYDEWYLESEF